MMGLLFDVALLRGVQTFCLRDKSYASDLRRVGKAIPPTRNQ